MNISFLFLFPLFPFVCVCTRMGGTYLQRSPLILAKTIPYSQVGLLVPYTSPSNLQYLHEVPPARHAITYKCQDLRDVTPYSHALIYIERK